MVRLLGAIIIIVLILMIVSVPVIAEKRALIIGISEYESQPRLRGPGNDIKLMEDLLKGWYGFKQRDITVLANSKARRVDIAREFSKLSKAAKGDVIAVYYSGHGTMAYLNGVIEEAIVPCDGDPEKPATFITTRELRTWLQDVPAGQVDLILDCCYSGGFTKEPRASGELKCVFPKNVPEDAIEIMEKTLVVTRPGHIVISASQTGRDVPDTEFPLADGTHLKVSALAFLLYRNLFTNPSITPQRVVDSLKSLMKSWGLDQMPGVGGIAGKRCIFGGPARGISARTIPLSKINARKIELLGGAALNLRNGAKVQCLDSHGAVVKTSAIFQVNWRRAWTDMPRSSLGVTMFRKVESN